MLHRQDARRPPLRQQALMHLRVGCAHVWCVRICFVGQSLVAVQQISSIDRLIALRCSLSDL